MKTFTQIIIIVVNIIILNINANYYYHGKYYHDYIKTLHKLLLP